MHRDGKTVEEGEQREEDLDRLDRRDRHWIKEAGSYWQLNRAPRGCGRRSPTLMWSGTGSLSTVAATQPLPVSDFSVSVSLTRPIQAP